MQHDNVLKMPTVQRAYCAAGRVQFTMIKHCGLCRFTQHCRSIQQPSSMYMLHYAIAACFSQDLSSSLSLCCFVTFTYQNQWLLATTFLSLTQCICAELLDLSLVISVYLTVLPLSCLSRDHIHTWGAGSLDVDSGSNSTAPWVRR